MASATSLRRASMGAGSVVKWVMSRVIVCRG